MKCCRCFRLSKKCLKGLQFAILGGCRLLQNATLKFARLEYYYEWIINLRLSVYFGFDIVCFQFAKQCAFVDAQFFSRSRLIALVSPQCFYNEKDFHLL